MEQTHYEQFPRQLQFLHHDQLIAAYYSNPNYTLLLYEVKDSLTTRPSSSNNNSNNNQLLVREFYYSNCLISQNVQTIISHLSYAIHSPHASHTPVHNNNNDNNNNSSASMIAGNEALSYANDYEIQRFPLMLKKKFYFRYF
jgi:hypothetical protein